MASFDILLLPGDGIGPEVMSEAKRVITWLNKRNTVTFNTEEAEIGGGCYDKHKVSVTDATVDKAHKAAACLFGAVGGPKWDNKVPYDQRPEAGLLRLRKELDLFANLRPAICYPALADASSLKRELVEGLDILILRELTGGTYFGEPKEIVTLENGQRRAVDTTVYTTSEIERVVKVGIDLASKRTGKLHSAEKRNVMKTGVLWNEVATATHKAMGGKGANGKPVELHHILADACAMQLVRAPKQFDVIVCDNLFGDMLSDEAAMLTGSIGMLPSASHGSPDASGRSKALYEPVHGSAPDIAGKGLANPIAMLTSFGMSLRYSFNQPEAADLIDTAIAKTLEKGLRTGDIMAPGSQRGGMKQVGTKEMGDAILAELERAS